MGGAGGGYVMVHKNPSQKSEFVTPEIPDKVTLISMIGSDLDVALANALCQGCCLIRSLFV